MVELLIRPTLHRFETCLDFVKEFHPGERDLVLTNKYIYEPYLGQMGLPALKYYGKTAKRHHAKRCSLTPTIRLWGRKLRKKIDNPAGRHCPALSLIYGKHI